MKKTIFSLFAICLISIVTVFLNGCDNKPHKHEYIGGKYNDTYHYEQCECGDIIHREPHQLGDYEEISEGPYTCLNPQVFKQECKICDYFKTFENNVVEHTASDWIVDTEPTCTSYGINYKECTVCYKELERDTQVAKLPHTESDWIIDQDSTCIETGTKHTECTVCYEVLETSIINLKEHSMTEWIELRPAGCEYAQELYRYCSTCFSQVETKTGDPAIGHTASDWIIETEATCTSYGYRYKDCVKCYSRLESEYYDPIEHNITEWAEQSPADCENAQVLERHCTTCSTQNQTKLGISALGHTESDWIIETEPTCYSYGINYKECIVCHKELERDTQVAKLPHTESGWIVDKDSTCTATGTKHNECEICHVVLNTNIIQKKEHSMTEWKEISPATCTESQKLARHCTTCSTQNQTKLGISALGHTESDWIIETEPTCYSYGINYKECIVCHKELERDTQVAKLPHTESDWIIDQDSTCIETGTKHTECEICHVVLNTNIIQKKEHSMTEWIELTPAGCEYAQELYRYCSTCLSQVETKTGDPAIGHTESDWIVDTESTCTSYGINYIECTVCHKELERDTQVAKLPHTESGWIVDKDSTCTATGTKHTECTECETMMSQGIVEMKSHNITEWAEQRPADCENAQVLERHCTTCSTQNQTMLGISALGHTASDWIIDQESTCTATGTKHTECTECETIMSQGIVEMKSHNITEWAEQSPADCENAQVLERHCTTCATQNQTKLGTSALGHTASDWIIETEPTCTSYGINYKECTVCHKELERDTQVAKLSHTASDWIIETEPTCTSYGINYKECIVCHEELERDTQVAKLPHTASDWIIDHESTCTATGTKHTECTECETIMSQGVVEMKAHNITDWTEQSPADCENAQVLERHCTTCSTQNETVEGLSAKGHKWSNPEETVHDGYYLYTQTCQNAGCQKVVEERKNYKTVYYDQTNCNVSIVGYISSKVVIGERVNVQINKDNNYIIEKLVYVLGTYNGNKFEPTSEEIYIYNNAFVMPDSDIQIICKCVYRSGKATLADDKVLLSLTANGLYSDNITINDVRLDLDYTKLIDQNINTNKSYYTFNVSSLEEFKLIQGKKLHVSFYTSFTFNENSEYSLVTGTGKFTPNSSSSVLIEGDYVSYTITETIQVEKKYSHEVFYVDVSFTILVKLNVKTQHRVTYISENSQVENVTLYTGDLITNIPEGEWFLDKNCTQAWNFETDVVDKDIVLYKKEV